MFFNRPKMLEDESLTSYLYRLSDCNYYDSPFLFTKLMGIKMHDLNANDISYTASQKISELISYNKDELYERTLTFHNLDKKTSQMFLMKSKVKFCQYCISEIPHHKWIWSFYCITYCDKHHKLLIDRCQVCQSHIEIKALMNDECPNCKCNLSNVGDEGIIQQSEVYQMQLCLLQKLKRVDSSTEYFSSLSFFEFLYFIKSSMFILEGLGSFIEPCNQKITSLINGRSGKAYSNSQYALACGNVYWMYHNFPEKFNKVLERFEMQIDPNIKKRRRKKFEELFNYVDFQFIEDAYKKFIRGKIENREVRQNLPLYNTKVKELAQSKFLTLKELIQESGLTRNEVETLISKEYLIPEVVYYGQKKHYKFSKVKSCEQIKKYKRLKKDLITKKEVASMLGIYVEKVNLLVNEGFLRKYKLPTSAHALFSSNEIKAILSSIDRLTVKKVEETYLLHDIIRKFAFKGVSIVFLLKKIQMRKLTPYATKRYPKLSEISFYQKEIELCILEEKLDGDICETFGLREVSRLLKVNDRMVITFIQIGLLKPHVIRETTKGKKRYYFNQQKVHAFKLKYLSTTEAAKLTGTSSKIIQKWVRKQEIKNHLEGYSQNFLIDKDELMEQINKRNIK